MREYIELGSAPYDEQCVQVGEENYDSLSFKECHRYKELLEKVFPNRPEGCRFSIKSFAHDFGTYREVVIYYNNDNSDEIEFAFMVESNLPSHWESTDIWDNYKSDLLSDDES